MTRISLGAMHARGIRLSPHEAIAVVHQVCELLKHGDDRGRPLAAPALIELFVTEDGGVDIDPKRPILAAASGGSFRNLIDELLPLDAGDTEKTSARDADKYAAPLDAHPFRFASDTTGTNERHLLRQLFERARRHVGTTEVRLTQAAPAELARTELAQTEPAQNRASPDRAGPDRAGPDRAGPDRATPDGATPPGVNPRGASPDGPGPDCASAD